MYGCSRLIRLEIVKDFFDLISTHLEKMRLKGRFWEGRSLYVDGS